MELFQTCYEAIITLITKPDKDVTKKKKNLQANTPDEYRDKNPQQILANKIQ